MYKPSLIKSSILDKYSKEFSMTITLPLAADKMTIRIGPKILEAVFCLLITLFETENNFA